MMFSMSYNEIVSAIVLIIKKIYCYFIHNVLSINNIIKINHLKSVVVSQMNI